MLSALGSGVPRGSLRGGLLNLSRFFHDGGKIHLKHDLVPRGRLLGVFKVKPGSVHATTSDSVGTLVLVEFSVLVLIKGLNNRGPHTWRGVRGIDEERHDYVLT